MSIRRRGLGAWNVGRQLCLVMTHHIHDLRAAVGCAGKIGIIAIKSVGFLLENRNQSYDDAESYLGIRVGLGIYCEIGVFDIYRIDNAETR